MQRCDAIKQAEDKREMAELILPVICENKECDHNCGECTEDLVAFLEEEV